MFEAHARRHLPETGFSRHGNNDAIIADLAAEPPEPFHRVITVGGKPLQDTVPRRTDTDAIEIATYDL